MTKRIEVSAIMEELPGRLAIAITPDGNQVFVYYGSHQWHALQGSFSTPFNHWNERYQEAQRLGRKVWRGIFTIKVME